MGAQAVPLLALTSSEELRRINQYVKLPILTKWIEYYKQLENKETKVIAETARLYSRLMVALMLLNTRNKDSLRNKFKLSNSLSLLFSIKPLIKWVVDKYCGENADKNRKLLTNLLTVVISLIKYPRALKYQRNYLSVYLTVVAGELMLTEYTAFNHFWLLCPFTFAKIWEYYKLSPEFCPKYAARVLHYFSKDIQFVDYGRYLQNKSKVALAVLPLFAALDYRKTKKLSKLSLAPLLQSIKLLAVLTATTSMANFLTMGKAFETSIPHEKRRLQIVGAISSLPTLVYFKANGVWLYLARLILISMNKKRSANVNSKLNRFRADKWLMGLALVILLNFKDNDKLKHKKFVNWVTSYINH